MTYAPAPIAREHKEDPIRILAVGNMYPPHHVGGYEVVWQAAMARARSLGHRVRILTSDYRDSHHRAEQDPDVHRTLRWYWDLDRYEFPELSVTDRIRVERHNGVELMRHLEEFRPDVVAWWSMGCMSLTLIERVRRADVRSVFIVHDDWLVYGPKYDQWIRMWRGSRLVLAPVIERLLGVPTRVELGLAGPFVFNSRYTLEHALRAGLTPKATAIVYPGIDERFLAAPTPEPWRWRLVYVGRIDRQKGVDVAVRALARLPPTASLSIWGSGEARYIKEMEALAVDLGVGSRVRFEGKIGSTELLGTYADADVVVFPVRWEEPFGLVPLEAMGMARPVVTTMRGGTAEFVRDGENALVFDVDDDAELARLIYRLAENGPLRERLRVGGMRTAAAHTVTGFAAKTVEHILLAASGASDSDQAYTATIAQLAQ